MKRIILTSLAATLLATGTAASATALVFRSATATFVQKQEGYDFAPGRMIDGVTQGTNGWAISTLTGDNPTKSQKALLALAQPLAPGAKLITFTIHQNWGSAETLGNFRLGYTTSKAPRLGDAQTPFELVDYSATGGATMTSPAPGQIIVSGNNPDRATYTVTVKVDAAVTGVFLNAIKDPAVNLAKGGPGRSTYNDGNFVITELTASYSEASGDR